MKKNKEIRNNTNKGLLRGQWRQLLLGSLLLVLLPGCFEPEEGCLDVEALNYDIDADSECDGCCVAPTMTLGVRHRFVVDDVVNRVFPHSSVFDPSTHLDDFGQAFQFKEIRYFLSNLRLSRVNGTHLGALDSLLIALDDGRVTSTAVVENNFALVESSILSDYDIGRIRGNGSFTSLDFIFGVAEPADEALIGELPDDHPLNDSTMYISTKEGLLFLDMEIYTDTIASQRDSLRVQLDNTDLLSALSLPVDFMLNPGFNVEIVLQADYASMLQGVNVRSDNAATIRQKIVDNLPNLFSVTEITSNND